MPDRPSEARPPNVTRRPTFSPPPHARATDVSRFLACLRLSQKKRRYTSGARPLEFRQTRRPSCDDSAAALCTAQEPPHTARVRGCHLCMKPLHHDPDRLNSLRLHGEIFLLFFPSAWITAERRVSAFAGAPRGGTAAGETAICEATASRKARSVVTPVWNLLSSLAFGADLHPSQFSCPFLARSCATTA